MKAKNPACICEFKISIKCRIVKNGMSLSVYIQTLHIVKHGLIRWPYVCICQMGRLYYISIFWKILYSSNKSEFALHFCPEIQRPLARSLFSRLFFWIGKEKSETHKYRADSFKKIHKWIHEYETQKLFINRNMRDFGFCVPVDTWDSRHCGLNESKRHMHVYMCAYAQLPMYSCTYERIYIHMHGCLHASAFNIKNS